MTLVIGIMTKENLYMICDKKHCISNKDGENISCTLKTDNGGTIILNAKKFFVNGHVNGSGKIQKIGDTLVGGAGDMLKVKNYVDFMRDKEVDIISATKDYYNENKKEAPDQLLILSKTGVNCFYQANNERMYSYNNEYFKNEKDDDLSLVAIGSGTTIFFPIYNNIREKIVNDYKKAFEKKENKKYIEEIFIDKIKQIYQDIGKYDDGVSAETELYQS